MQCELGFAVNQLLFMQTLFCNLLEKIGLWLLIQNADYYLKNKITEKFEDWFTSRYIRDDEALMNLIEISPIALLIKVSLKHFTHFEYFDPIPRKCKSKTGFRNLPLSCISINTPMQV